MESQSQTQQMDLVHEIPNLHIEEPNTTVNSTDRDRIAQTLVEAGAGPVVKQLARVFAYIEIADQEMKRSTDERPERAADIRKAFVLLCWRSDVLPLPTDEVYRAHAREIINRVINGRKVEYGTSAEALMALSQQSLKAPLNQTGLCAMQRMFAEVMEVDVDFAPEPYPGAAQELLSTLKTKLTAHRDVSAPPKSKSRR